MCKKEFKTLDEQINILKNRVLSIENGILQGIGNK